MPSTERFRSDSQEPIVGVVTGAKVKHSAGSVGLKNLVWISPHRGSEPIPGVGTDKWGEVVALDIKKAQASEFGQDKVADNVRNT